MTFLIDGSRDDDATYYQRPDVTHDWRSIATCSTAMRDTVLRPEVRAVMAESTHHHVYGYRYLEPEHLVEPWTPALLLNIQWVQTMVSHYPSWNKLGDHPWPWWDGPDVSDPTATTGERVFQVALHTFRQAGLDEWVAWGEAQRETYRKRVAWLTADVTRWVPFQLDINSPSLFIDVKGPADWQVVVDAVLAEKTYSAKEFLQQMRMASLQYIKDELPGPHTDATRKHDPGMSFGYGTSTTMPSFGYRREHRTDILFIGWAAATMSGWDLFGPAFWPTIDETDQSA